MTAMPKRYLRRRRIAIANGQWQPWVDADSVRRHVTTLMAAGVSCRRVAEAAGVAAQTVLNLFHPEYGGRKPAATRVHRRTAEAILAVTAEAALAKAATTVARYGNGGWVRVSATGTIRRIQALAAIGWPLAEQAKSVGWTRNNFYGLLHRKHVAARTAQLVAELYDQLSMTPAPTGPATTRAQRNAARMGWLPPLAWDDQTIDQPTAGPAVGLSDEDDADPGLIWLAQHGYLTPAELPAAERAALHRLQEATADAA